MLEFTLVMFAGSECLDAGSKYARLAWRLKSCSMNARYHFVWRSVQLFNQEPFIPEAEAEVMPVLRRPASSDVQEILRTAENLASTLQLGLGVPHLLQEGPTQKETEWRQQHSEKPQFWCASLRHEAWSSGAYIA